VRAVNVEESRRKRRRTRLISCRCVSATAAYDPSDRVGSGGVTSLRRQSRKIPRNISFGVASGGVWKTVNNGITWTPVFDNEGSYSIGTVTLDPKTPSTVWVGTGERTIASGA